MKDEAKIYKGRRLFEKQEMKTWKEKGKVSKKLGFCHPTNTSPYHSSLFGDSSYMHTYFIIHLPQPFTFPFPSLLFPILQTISFSFPYDSIHALYMLFASHSCPHSLSHSQLIPPESKFTSPHPTFFFLAKP